MAEDVIAVSGGLGGTNGCGGVRHGWFRDR
jgi:hypothetical protein